MTDLINISDFSYAAGLNIGKDDNSLVYLYGLSDFWQILFQDTSLNNLLLEANSVQASDIYNNFLQLCSGISLESLATSANSQLRLELISDTPTLPYNVPITSTPVVTPSTTISGVIVTMYLSTTAGISVGDTIMVSNVENMIIDDVGSTINDNPIDHSGTNPQTVYGAGWNGTFTVSSVVQLSNKITYYMEYDPGRYTANGVVSVLSIGSTTYQLSETILSSRFLANRPFLPTIVLEENVDYTIDADSARIIFAKPIGSYGFPSRVTSTSPTINQYSLWSVDARYDEQLIYSTFATVLGRTLPAVGGIEYSNLLYGLYFMYSQGPTLNTISKGINLALGIPLARDSEVVLDIRNYIGISSQYVVTTDLNSYLLPPGIEPSTAVQESYASTLLGLPESSRTFINTGDEIGNYVVLFDYVSTGTINAVQTSTQIINKDNSTPSFLGDGTWWRPVTLTNISSRYSTLTLQIPPEILPIPPLGYTRDIVYFVFHDPGYETGNTINIVPIDHGDAFPYLRITSNYSDWVMNTYLKNNVFLVVVTVSKDQYKLASKFEDLYNILLKLKPAHTYPIYGYLS